MSSYPPPVSQYLSVGQRIQGAVVGIDHKTGATEISLKKAIPRISGLARAVADWTVVHASEFGAVLKLDGATGAITPEPQAWSRYQVLWSAGILVPGAIIRARATSETDRHGRCVLRLAGPPRSAAEDAVQELAGELIFWRPDALAKRDQKLRNILYVHTRLGQLWRVECNDVIDIEEHFSIGDQVSVVPTTTNINGIPVADLAASHKPKSSIACIKKGNRVSGKVVHLLPGGARVVVSPGVSGYLIAS